MQYSAQRKPNLHLFTDSMTYDDGEQTLSLGVLVMQSFDVTMNFCD